MKKPGLPCDLCDAVVTNITSRPVMTFNVDGKQRQYVGKVICQQCAEKHKEGNVVIEEAGY